MSEDKNLLTGNVGEWSEVYVFFRLLADGRLDVANEKLEAVPNEFYKVLAILRNEATSTNEYLRADDNIVVKIRNNYGNEEIFKMSVARFAENAQILLTHLLNAKNRTDSYPDIQSFLEELKISGIKDVGHKRDITISIEDIRSGIAQTLGFSIKSYLGSNSTLFNPSPGTNFIYRVNVPEDVLIDCDTFNATTYKGIAADRKNGIKAVGKISHRIQELIRQGCTLSYEGIQSDNFYQNLRTIDGDLPQVLAYALLYKYTYQLKNWEEIIAVLNESNPLGYRINAKSPVYEFKIKRFLQDSAMGMTAESPWSGFYDANGGQIIVKRDGDIVCYHVYELNRYLQYLFNETNIEQPSTGEDGGNPGHIRINPKTGKPAKPFLFGWLYEQDGNLFLKINFQVRFKGMKKNS